MNNMTLVRWKPLNEMVSLQSEINRVFDDVWRERSAAPRAWYPAVDLVENPDEFRLVAELPGLTRDQVKITFSDNIVTLRGEKRSAKEEKREEWHVVERSYGAFERSFHLNAPIKPDQVRARFEDGVLTVTLPKSEESRAREIQIEG
jgi:HSP20 family protein